ncbi:MAG: ABC transporter ATP-binding protein [Planctomycetota bacterium]
MAPSNSILSAGALRYGFPDRPDFLGPLDVRMGRGGLTGIIGPNGAGKTTLLRLLAGILKPKAGVVRLADVDLTRTSTRDRARRLAYLPQKPPSDLASTALEVVLMGRFPHRTYHLFESQRDVEICREAMRLTGTSELGDRNMATLSGGEAQRVHLAAALAQQPEVLLLDEPTSALDLYHQLVVFGLLVRLTREQGLACVVVTHDLNLVGRHCDRLVLLDNGSIVASGKPEQVLTDDVLAPVYGVRFAVYRFDPNERPWIFPQDLPAAPSGAKTSMRIADSSAP